MSKTDVLKNIPFFSSVDNIKEYIEQQKIYFGKYAKGTTVFNCGDHCTTIDVVLSGSLVGYSLTQDGSATTMFEFKAGSILGANLLFVQKHCYPLNIYCRSDCALAHIKKSTIEELLHNYNFVLQYIKSLSHNSQGLHQKIAMLSQKTLRENIIDYLKQQSAMQKTDAIILPISKKELADYLGVQRPSLFRELKKMKDEGVIHVQNRTIILSGHSGTI